MNNYFLIHVFHYCISFHHQEKYSYQGLLPLTKTCKIYGFGLFIVAIKGSENHRMNPY